MTGATRVAPREETEVLFRCICRYVSRHGTGPTYGEMSAMLNWSDDLVSSRLRTLEADGLISRIPGQGRTVRPVTQGECLICGSELLLDGSCPTCVGRCVVCGRVVRRAGQSRVRMARGWRHSECWRSNGRATT